MEQTKGRKAFYIGLSVLIALLVWFYANGDTEVEISVNDVPLSSPMRIPHWRTRG